MGAGILYKKCDFVVVQFLWARDQMLFSIRRLNSWFRDTSPVICFRESWTERKGNQLLLRVMKWWLITSFCLHGLRIDMHLTHFRGCPSEENGINWSCRVIDEKNGWKREAAAPEKVVITSCHFVLIFFSCLALVICMVNAGVFTIVCRIWHITICDNFLMRSLWGDGKTRCTQGRCQEWEDEGPCCWPVTARSCCLSSSWR